MQRYETPLRGFGDFSNFAVTQYQFNTTVLRSTCYIESQIDALFSEKKHPFDVLRHLNTSSCLVGFNEVAPCTI